MQDPLAAGEIWGAVKDGISEIWSIELLLILTLLLIIILAAIHFYRLNFRASKYQTYLLLDLQAADFTFYRIMAKLPCNSQTYRFDINNGMLKLEHQLGLAVLYLDNILSVTNKLSGHKENIANRLWLYPWEKSALQPIISSQYVATVTLLD